jgi:hypothetical protein
MHGLGKEIDLSFLRGPQIAARTVAMLGASVTSFETNENETLALTFSNGHRLTILD